MAIDNFNREKMMSRKQKIAARNLLESPRGRKNFTYHNQTYDLGFEGSSYRAPINKDISKCARVTYCKSKLPVMFQGMEKQQVIFLRKDFVWRGIIIQVQENFLIVFVGTHLDLIHIHKRNVLAVDMVSTHTNNRIYLNKAQTLR